MSTAPILTWTEGTDEDTENLLSIWNMGKLNAGETSQEKIIHIWNNKGGTESVSDMRDVQFTVLSNDGECDAVNDNWFSIRCISTPNGEEQDTTYYPIGKNLTHTITAENCDRGIIKGIKNDGEINNIQNYASIGCICTIPASASNGKRELFGRVIYYYI